MSHASDLPTSDECSSMGTTLFLAGVLGASGVIIGAFGAHYLGTYLADQGIAADLIVKRLAQFDTGARYHLVHAAAMLGLAGWQKNSVPALRSTVFGTAAILMVIGVVLFSGSLYLLALSGKTWFGAITPLGGLCWIVAWTMLAIAGWKNR